MVEKSVKKEKEESSQGNGERAIGRAILQRLPVIVGAVLLLGGGGTLGAIIPGLGAPSTGTVASIDARLARIETLLDSIDRMLRDHEMRLRDVERTTADHEATLNRKAAR